MTGIELYKQIVFGLRINTLKKQTKNFLLLNYLIILRGKIYSLIATDLEYGAVAWRD